MKKNKRFFTILTFGFFLLKILEFLKYRSKTNNQEKKDIMLLLSEIYQFHSRAAEVVLYVSNRENPKKILSKVDELKEQLLISHDSINELHDILLKP